MDPNQPTAFAQGQPTDIGWAVQLSGTIRPRLLRHARQTISAHLAGDFPPPSNDDWPELPRCGVFVTLCKSGHLRGCIGVFSPSDDLPTTIANMAAAAVADPRFLSTPLAAGDLADLRIEISLLSPLVKIDDPLAFELGKHGVYVKRGVHVGCFLPDVATERRWDKETFLTQCCTQKAGLGPGAWNEPGTEVFVFTVEKLCD